MATAGSPRKSPPRSAQTASDLTLKALGAGATGIGMLGVIAGVGGAIMFERFSQAGLPAEQAVAVQPRTVLLAVGAEALVPLAATMLLVVAAYWILAQRLRISTSFFAVAAGLGAILYYLAVVSFSFKLHVLLSVIAATCVGCALWALLAGLVSSIGARALILAVITALLGCAIALIRTIDAPKVRGAVVVLARSGKVVAGIYVAETSEQVYLGQVALADSYDDKPKAGSGAIIAISRADISTVAFASNQGLPTALRQASLMARGLKEEPDGTSLASRLAETARPADRQINGKIVEPTTSPNPHAGAARASRPSEDLVQRASSKQPRLSPGVIAHPRPSEKLIEQATTELHETEETSETGGG